MNTVDDVIKTLFFSQYREDNLTLDVYQHKTIKSCKPCEGTGFTNDEELSCYHKREWTTYTKVCKGCAGSGRVTMTKTTVKIPTNYPYPDFSMKVETSVPYPDDPINTSSVETINGYKFFAQKS